MAQNIALAEPAVAVAQKGRMIGDLTLQSQTATKPAIGQIEMNLFTQPPLGADGEAIADDEHPDHQFRIDRGPANCATERLSKQAARGAPLVLGFRRPGI
jgi:hypothetical protein